MCLKKWEEEKRAAFEAKLKEKEEAARLKEEERIRKEEEREAARLEREANRRKPKTALDKVKDQAINNITRTAGNALARGILGSFKKFF